MTWISTVSPGDASGIVERVYESCERQFGFVPNIRRAMSLAPEALRAYVQLSSVVYSGGPLNPIERELVATTVSAINKCHYWTESHAEFLRKLTGDDDLVDAVKSDWRTAGLSTRVQAMLAFAEKLTRTPAECSATDVELLRRNGLRDGEILALVLLAGFFNLATRVADGLGIELDAELTRGSEEYERYFSTGLG